MAGGSEHDQKRMDRERRRSRNRKLALGFFLFVGVVVVLESPLARVRHLAVTGNRTVPAGAILADLPIRVGASLWQVNARAVEQAILDKQPMIQSVAVSLHPLQGLVDLKVQERHVVAVFSHDGVFYTLLNDGLVYQQVPASNGFAWPIVTASIAVGVAVGKPIPDTFVANLCEQLGQASAALTENVSEINLNAYGDATLYLNNGFVAQCKEQAFASQLPNIYQAIQYFSSRGYQPGVIDMTGAAPYRYTPFTPSTGKAGSP
ncbi:MAG: hypothetical protein A2201_06715 [Alicyclobacillus sp. RIFOXYA1_FULL_53_8]|nr:MAG: hypothetical protein A2201_06715 [Alicyclobacillus sp. RIFOXYA1_FULL_53_8]